MSSKLGNKFSGTGKNIVAFMGHVAIQAHINTEIFKRLRGGDCREGVPFVDKMGAYGLPCCKIMRRRLSFNNRNCDARPVTKRFEPGKQALHLGKALMVMRCKKDSKVISKCSRAFFKGVCITVSRVSEYVPSTAEVTKKSMNDDNRKDTRQGATLPKAYPEGYVC